MSLLAVGVIATSAFAATADHLIISEVVVQTATGSSPFIEIENPTGSPIPMDNVYLTNGAAAPATYYYNIALLDPASANPGGGTAGGFHARFPAGFVLPASGSIAIALNGSAEYLAAYGNNPDFELFEDGAEPDGVPEMLEAYQESINAGLGGAGNAPALSATAASLILYSWDGATDLVQDLDYVMWGADNNVRIDKTGISIGGGSYKADTAVASQEAAAATGPVAGSSLRRINTDEGTETLTGGNGIGGHDETSENLATTFPEVVGHEPPAIHIPPYPTAPIATAGGIDPAAPYDGQAVTLSVTLADQDEVEETVFHYTVDGGADLTLGGNTDGSGVWTATVPAQAEGAVVAWWCEGTNTESMSVVYPAGSPNFAASWTVAQDPDPGTGPGKLLLTEVSTTGTDQEFVEIYNPGTVEVDLSDYYLTDANYSSGNQYYYRIAEGNPSQTTIGGGAFYDFHARFPAGFTIAGGDTIVVTVAGSDVFFAAFGFNPDLELFEDGAASDAVPDMRWVFGDEGSNSIVGETVPTLSNTAETVILYHFVTGEDKVIDIDVFAWKDPSSTTTSHFFNKTGVTVGSHSYLPEKGTNINDAFGSENAFGNSYHRTDATEGGQTPTGSNGVGGRDETSENFNNTFAMMPYDPSAPGGGGPALDPDKLLITEVCTKDVGAEFIEILNPGTAAVDMGSYYLTDAVNTPASQFYWRIAEGSPSAATVGGGADGDFHAKFPDGFSLAAGDTIVIAVGGSTAFNAAYGFMPDLKLFENDSDDDNVPSMDFIFGDGSNNSIIGATSTPALSPAAETVVLYSWKAGEDRVVDIDVFFWKDALSADTSFLFSKTGVTVGSHSYLDETATTAQTPFNSETDPGMSYHRTDANEGTQTPTGSNGVDGRDETSENFDGTFQMAAADPAQPAPPPVGGDAVKLLLTEICTLGSDQEFIEIHNPGTVPVDLSDYYLTDANHSPNSQYYYNIGLGNPSQSTVGGGAFSDFHARFPDGYSIAAGDTIVIAVPGSSVFFGEFGFNPDLELYEDGGGPDGVPDMRWIFGNASSNSIVGESSPTLTNSAETIILYHFVEGEDKVTDIDVFVWKDPDESTTSSIFFNKTGKKIGSHSYLPENGTNSGDAFNKQNDFGNSYQRINGSEGDQTPTGSNGVDGRDETSEKFNTTFEMKPYSPSMPAGGDQGSETVIQLRVPARTFLPGEGEEFPIAFISNPRSISETRVRVFDLEGRLVVTLFDSRFDGNPPNLIYWDGRDSLYERVKGGMYVVHLSSVDIKTGKQENETAPVVVATRLSN
ncbi:MAG: lamin tail domain-containing protein [Candidatus Krumholzibacteria bacterium]|nr:lamin tail domain-containing protein [Candidatus Krumholzibacteria bacterium]